MASKLAPCPACARHVRIVEARCPFCAASIEGMPVPARARPTTRLGRAALFAFGTAALAPGCYEHHIVSDDPPPPGVVADAAVAPRDAAVAPRDAFVAEDAEFAPGLLYGGAPEPIELDAGAAEEDDGGFGGPSADYGGPPAD